MAATNYTPISLYYSATASSVPVNTNLVAGELALNTNDGKLFYKDSSGVVQVLATKGGVGTSSTTQVLYNSSGLVVGSAGLTFDGTNLATTGTATATRFIPSGSTVATNGLYLPAANSIGISTNSTNAVYIDSSQNVGIGTSSPTTYLGDKFVAYKSTASTTGILNIASVVGVSSGTTDSGFGSRFLLYTQNANGNQYPAGIAALNSTGGSNLTELGFYTATSGPTLTERMRIDSSGNLLVGVTSASYSSANRGVINIGGSSGGLLSLISSTNKSYFLQSGADLLLENDTTTGNIIFGTNASTERMRIDSSGNLLVGTTSTLASIGARLNIVATGNQRASVTGNGNVGEYMTNTSGTGNWQPFSFCNAGTAFTQIGSITTTASATAFNTSSDYRLKENIAPMQNALATVAQLKPVTYKWKTDGSDGQGFIAHELQEIVPDCVTGEKDGVDEDGNPKYQGVDTSFLVATLTKAIQEQQAMITNLSAQVTALQLQIDTMQ